VIIIKKESIEILIGIIDDKMSSYNKDRTSLTIKSIMLPKLKEIRDELEAEYENTTNIS